MLASSANGRLKPANAEKPFPPTRRRPLNLAADELMVYEWDKKLISGYDRGLLVFPKFLLQLLRV
jgi:hypothetical protein